jgi:hypothetical protein
VLGPTDRTVGAAVIMNRFRKGHYAVPCQFHLALKSHLRFRQIGVEHDVALVSRDQLPTKIRCKAVELGATPRQASSN